MSMKEDPGRAVLHAPGAGGSLGWYSRGCRCLPCRAANADAAARGRKRKAMGTFSPYQLVPSGPSRDVLLRMRAAGMVWDGMQSLVGADRRDLQRIVNRGEDGSVTRRMEGLIFAAEARLAEQPGLVDTERRILDDGVRLRWMINCLQARGWPSGWIGEQIGWSHPLSASVIPYDRVTVDLVHRLEELFGKYQWEWGPSRVAAVRAWRAGKFPSDCYDADLGPEQRYLPVPGSLHPDLVAEACQFSRKRERRGWAMRKEMRRRWGQWERESCAVAAYRAWSSALGRPAEDGHGEACSVLSHQHGSVPAVWIPAAAG